MFAELEKPLNAYCRCWPVGQKFTFITRGFPEALWFMALKQKFIKQNPGLTEVGKDFAIDSHRVSITLALTNRITFYYLLFTAFY